MHAKTTLLLLLCCSILSSCFIADSFFSEESTQTKTIDLQKKAEESVTNKITSQLEDSTNYKPYGFSELKITKPITLSELEDLEAKQRLSPSDSSITKQIEAKRLFIRENNIERTATLDHFFTLSNDTASINVLEINYVLNDTLAVKKTIPKLILEIPSEDKLILDYYFKEHTLFLTQSYTEGKRMSKTFYRFFKDQLETYELVQDKSNFLKHSLEVCKLVKLTGKFDQDHIVQSIFKQHIAQNRKDIEEYTPLQFSKLYETVNNEDNSVLGYYFFHKFIGNYKDKTETNVVLVEFTPYYEVTNVFQLEGTFESYTKDK